jgi:hypothetical protein
MVVGRPGFDPAFVETKRFDRILGISGGQRRVLLI